MSDGKVGLGAAAAALEAELRRFEQLAELATRVELKSRASGVVEHLLVNVADVVEPGQVVAELDKTILEARVRQVGILDRDLLAAVLGQALEALLGQFARLGDDAAEVNELLKQTGAVDEAEERLGAVAEAAEAVLREAEREGFDDAVRQAESIRQQSLAARNKLKLLRERKT